MRLLPSLAALLTLAAVASAQDTTVVVRHLAPRQDSGVVVRHLPVQPSGPPYAAPAGAPHYAFRSSQLLLAKDPRTATSLSFLFPGAGQYYAGMPGKGLAITALAIGAPIIGYADVNSQPNYNCGFTPFGAQYSCRGRRDYTPAAIGLGVGVAAWLYGAATAGTDAERWNRAHGIRVVNAPGRFGFAVAVP
jgi:hypothetical protein